MPMLERGRTREDGIGPNRVITELRNGFTEA